MRRSDGQERGLGKPETFTFLGFTFICGKTRQGNFLLCRKTRRDRMMAKLLEVKEELRRRMHQPIPEQGAWLRQVMTGFFNYHAVPTNSAALQRLPLPYDGSLAPRAPAAQPEGPDRRGSGWRSSPPTGSRTAHPSSMAKRSVRRQTPEVGAVCVMWRR